MEEEIRQLEDGELFGNGKLEHEKDGEHELEIFEHGEMSTEDEAFEKLAKVLGMEPEEVREIWRKGNEFDGLSEELGEAKGDSEVFERLAEIRGISKAEMKDEILWALEKANTEKMIGEIMESNPGMNRKTAEELAKFRLGAQKVKEEKNDSGWEEKLRELDGFLAQHSGESIEKLDAGVVEEWENGIPLETAFEKFMLMKEKKELFEELEQMKNERIKEAQKAYAKEHSPGSATSAAGISKADEFVEGLFKEY